MLGGELDDNGCLASAGFTWCEKQNECVRSWELEGEWDDECTVENSSSGDVSSSTSSSEEEPSSSTEDDNGMLGGESDDNGCLASAGFTWCEKQNECVRSWELEGEWDDECTVENSSSGASSSSSSSSEESSSSTEDVNGMLGGESDDNGCLASAGFTWCEKQNECVRSWELEGEWDDECAVENSSSG